MKTIDQAAKEYGESVSPHSTWTAKNAETSFKAGVKFREHWIDPKKQMPPVGELVQVKIKWRDHEYSYDHDKRVIADGYDDFEINQMCGLEVVGWRPINLK